MKTLSETWFADGYIDFELKKYTLLAYLQNISRQFDENILYPPLDDLIFHYRNIISFKKNKQFLQEQFTKRLSGLQLQKLQLLYEHIIDDDELMKELEDIIHYAEEEIQKTINSGTIIYEMVEEKMKITPVGLVPLDLNEGYFFLSKGSSNQTQVYQYRLSFFEKHDEKYRTIKTQFVDSWYRTISNTYENIKQELLRHRAIINPAVYLIEIGLSFPVEQTLLPVAKRSLVRYITTQAA